MSTSIGRSAAHAPRGFTLVDLVGVLAVTGTLAAVLFPVFGRAREKASQSFCMAGRSQFIRATATYSEDYDEAWVRNPNSLTPYVRAAIYTCPTNSWAGPPRFCETRDVVARRNSHGAGGGGHHSSDLLYHTGPIMPAVNTYAIFWGTKWGNTTFDGDKVTGLGSLYSGLGGSSYIGTDSEYTDASGANFKGGVKNAAAVKDTTQATGGSSTSAILAEVCKATSNNPDPNGFYAVYVDVPRGNAGYCAWHSAGSCTQGGAVTQFAFFFNLDGDAGCDPGDDPTLTGHSQGLAALANVTGHELSEAITDPHLNAWYDRQGAENADKCAWTFNGHEKIGSSLWLIQGNWSNLAHTNGTSYSGTNSGCVNGSPKGNSP